MGGSSSPWLLVFLRLDWAVARARTIANLWRDAVEAAHPDPAYLHEVDGDWVEVTWADAARAVDELANGLLALGVQKGDAFGLLASTSLAWSQFDFALALVGAVGAPIYASSSARDTQYVLEHSGAVGVLVEDDEQRSKVAGAGVRHIISFSDLDELRERGRAYAVEQPTALDERADSIDEDDLFTFIYTSGTTGPPKACMIRHRNYYAMVQKGDEMDDPLTAPGDVMLVYLPLAHNYGRLLHLSSPYTGFTIAFLPDPLRAAAELPRVRPHVFPSVPRVYEKIYAAITGRVRPPVRREEGDPRLGAPGRVSRFAAPPGRATGAARAPSAPPTRRQARVLEGEGTTRRPGAGRQFGRSPAVARDRRVLPRDRHPDPRGLWALGDHDRCDRQPQRRLQVRNRREASARCRARVRRGRGDPDPLGHGVRRLLPRSPPRPPRHSTPRDSSTPATSAIWTTTASW